MVHEDYGVGRYLGLTTMDAAGMPAEFLVLEYADGDKLYVPVQALERISRYTGAPAETAPLHKLGGEQWSKARAKAAAKIRDAAAELLDVYSRRATRVGHAFALDEQQLHAFEAGFPFEETADQAAAIQQVLDDLRSPRPMDRVVCGDVGFGKTEVALRAAFVAVQGGKQVAVLVPTTLLAQQHYQTFADRFADWPVKVELLSRFRGDAQAKAALAGLADGKVDIVIGTHRLLQPGVRFKDLGLLVIDEEHRFGVRDKERLKALRAEVDVLTLTATPIPRTLNMALGGLRDLSLITTPPVARLSIKTFVSEWNAPTIREACLRELRRGGQVYFVHNSIDTIDGMAQQLGELVPEARIVIGHGQMRERDLEQVMLDFYHKRSNLLLCTTIIESGIDVPTANTIVIDRADRFGLAQLHQLRGRVGRSHHQAYAYLVTPPKNAMTSDAKKRLEALESLEDLGAGFVLATHDLEIRGAGELLGEGQSGQIQEIGFALYMELLERAVAALRAGKTPELERPLHHGPEIDLHVPSLLPEAYLPDVHARLVLYKRISAVTTEVELDDLQAETIDRFGLLPEPAKNLFRIARLRSIAAPLGVERLDVAPGGGSVTFAAETPIDPGALILLVQRSGRSMRFDGPSKLRFTGEHGEPEQRFDAAGEAAGRAGQVRGEGIGDSGQGQGTGDRDRGQCQRCSGNNRVPHSSSRSPIPYPLPPFCLHSVAAMRLRTRERALGRLEQQLAAGGARRDQRRHADAHREVAAGARARMVNGQRADATRDVLGVLAGAVVWHRHTEQQEFIIGETRHDIARAAHGRGDGAAHLAQHVLGGAAAEHLEVVTAGVDVDVHQRQAAPVTLRDRPVAAQHLHQVLRRAQPARPVERLRQGAGCVARHGAVMQRESRIRQQHGPAFALDGGAVGTQQLHALPDADAGAVRVNGSLHLDVVETATRRPLLRAVQQTGQGRVCVHDARPARDAVQHRDAIQRVAEHLGEQRGIERAVRHGGLRHASSLSCGASRQWSTAARHSSHCGVCCSARRSGIGRPCRRASRTWLSGSDSPTSSSSTASTPARSLHSDSTSQPAASARRARSVSEPAKAAPPMLRSSENTAPVKPRPQRNSCCTQRRENPAGASSTSGNSTCATMIEARPLAISCR